MIHGARVRQAREARGFTQTMLAERLDVTQSFIAQVETGQRPLPDDLAQRLAFQTGFPVSFLRQPPPPELPLGSLLFRARSSASARNRARAHRWFQVVFELAEKLATRMKPRPNRLPQLGDRSIDPRQAARLTRAALGLSPDTPIRHVINAAERAGVLVLALPVPLEGFDAFSTWADRGKTPVLVLFGSVPGDRLRFSVAHEVKHLAMDREINRPLRDIEREADIFASEFLLPEVAMLQEIVPPVTLTSLAPLKMRWGTSLQALIRRAFDLGIVTQRQYHYLFEQLSARGWRRDEPGAASISVERPRALRQMIEMQYGEAIDYRKVASEMNLSPQMLMEIVEMYAGKGATGHTIPTRTEDDKVVELSVKRDGLRASAGHAVVGEH